MGWILSMPEEAAASKHLICWTWDQWNRVESSFGVIDRISHAIHAARERTNKRHVLHFCVVLTNSLPCVGRAPVRAILIDRAVVTKRPHNLSVQHSEVIDACEIQEEKQKH